MREQVDAPTQLFLRTWDRFVDYPITKPTPPTFYLTLAHLNILQEDPNLPSRTIITPLTCLLQLGDFFMAYTPMGNYDDALGTPYFKTILTQIVRFIGQYTLIELSFVISNNCPLYRHLTLIPLQALNLSPSLRRYADLVQLHTLPLKLRLDPMYARVR